MPTKKTKLKRQPKISIIVPIYNTEAYIQECINSILNQTLTDFELICVDDGSTDNSVKVANKTINNDNRCIIIKLKHKNAGHARNIGLKKAKGEYLYFLDSDDFIAPILLETMYNKAKQTKADVVICQSESLNVYTGKYSPIGDALKTALLPQKTCFNCLDITQDAFQFFTGWPWDKLYKKSFIDKEGLNFQEIRSTNDLFFVNSAIILSHKISIVQQTLVTHRIGDKNSLENTREKNPYCFIQAIKKFINFMKRKKLFDIYHYSLSNYLIDFCLWQINTTKNTMIKKIQTNKISHIFKTNLYLTPDFKLKDPNLQHGFNKIICNDTQKNFFQTLIKLFKRS